MIVRSKFPTYFVHDIRIHALCNAQQSGLSRALFDAAVLPHRLLLVRFGYDALGRVGTALVAGDGTYALLFIDRAGTAYGGL